MYSIKKWIASKISSNPSNDESGEFSAEAGRSSSFNYSNGHEQSSSHQSQAQLPFDVSNGAKTILQFYYSDDELNMIASELESFDGRRDPLRCTELVSQLRIAQDKVMQLLFQLMDEWNCNRAPRDYRLKFPEDLLNDGENGESFNGQIWFSAECLASGSDIMNHEAESDMLRPLAKVLTNNLDQLRIMLRQSSNQITNKIKFYQDLIHRMETFDRMFSAFEFEYVKAMLPIKSVDDIEKQQELTVLFSEALGFALKRNLITQIDVDEFNPSVMIALPRLAIVHGLVRCGNDNPLFRRHKHNLSNMFKSYHSSLHRIHGMLKSLRPVEIFMLEKLLSNEENLSDCVDSIFEEPGSFKQQLNDDYYHSERPKASDRTERLPKKKKRIQVKSSSLPNLSCLNEANEMGIEHLLLNQTTDDRMIATDEVDASFKKVTRLIKRCVSQLLHKSQNEELSYKNVYFDEQEQQFNGYGDPHESYYHHQPQISQQESGHPYSSSPQCSGPRYLNVAEPRHQFNSSPLDTSQQSTSVTGSASSMDSFESPKSSKSPNLALNAKGSNYISALAKQLLHKLFVSISGIADQLQSNFATDLRQILKLVFVLHTSAIDEADCASLEEGEEALESTTFSNNKTSNFEEMLSNSENFAVLFSTTLNAIENAQTNSGGLPREETVDDDDDGDEFQFNHHNSHHNHGDDRQESENNLYYENYPNDYRPSTLDHSINPTNDDELARYPQPLWVPDEQTTDCTKCKIQFTLLRRRHHCRNCGQIFCNSCSRHFICLLHFGYQKPVRVCDQCYQLSKCELDDQQAPRQSLR